MNTFYWWDNALEVASRRAMLTGIRWRVFRDGDLWRIRAVR